MANHISFVQDAPFPELAEALRSQIEKTIKIWLERVREEIPTVKDLSDVQLRDNLHNILSAMAERCRWQTVLA